MNQERLWEIEKYVTQEGVCPFDEWFETLDSQFQARIAEMLNDMNKLKKRTPNLINWGG